VGTVGTVWRPELCLRTALFDSLKDKEQAELDFEVIATTSIQDPIFNNTWHKEWIDHVLYTESPDESWVVNAEVHERMPDGTPICERFEHASHHFPVSAAVTI